MKIDITEDSLSGKFSFVLFILTIISVIAGMIGVIEFLTRLAKK
jgi:hypothetical protein